MKNSKVVLPVIYIASLLVTVLLASFELPNRSLSFWVASMLGITAWCLLCWQAILSFRRSSKLWNGEYLTQLTLHKWSGYLGILTLIVHPLAINIAYGYNLVFPTGLPETSFDIGVAQGRLALFFSLILLVTGILLGTKVMSWRVWQRFHYTAYLILPFVVLHASAVGTITDTKYFSIWFVLLSTVGIITLALRLLERFGLFSRSYTVIKTQLHGEILDITLQADTKPIGKTSYNDFVFLHINGSSGPFSLLHTEENGARIRFGIKVSGFFTRQLQKLKPFDIVRIDGPYKGSMHEVSERPSIFIGGGIGIARYYTAIHRAKKSDKAFWLVKQREDAWLEKEFNAEHLPIKVAILTSENSRWTVEKLASTNALVPQDYDWYICGPESLISDYTKQLFELGVSATAIKTEHFKLA